MSIDAQQNSGNFFNVQIGRLRASSVPWNTTRSTWFGCTGEISKNFSPREPKNLKSLVEKTTEKFKRMEKARNHAQNKVESNKTLAHNIELHKKEILYLTRQIEKVTKYQELVQKCAVKIQKVARGYLVRKGLEIEIMAIRRRSVNTWVKQLKKSDDYYFFKLGSKPLKAALLIQRQVRKFLFRAKMRRILHTYHLIRQQRVVEIENFLRTGFRIVSAKKVIFDIKFEKFKAQKLVKIRQKLCILLFKSFWRKNKFTFKIVMTRIKKYKRMKRNEQRLKASNANLMQGKANGRGNKELLGVNEPGAMSSRSSFADDSEFGSDKEENKGKEEVESNTSEINKKLEAERQQKIAITKLSYSIPKNKEPLNVLPYLYQKDILEGVSPPSHHITTTRASVFRMNDSNPKRHNPSKAKEEDDSLHFSFIKPKTTSSSRPKQGNDGNPLYMKPTTAYKMSRWDAEAPGDEAEEHKKNLKPRDDSKVLSPTFTSIQKVSKVFMKKEKNPVWRPSTQHQNPYVTNLENFSFPAPEKKTSKRPTTMSYSPRLEKKDLKTEEVKGSEIEARMEVNTLSFNAALPNLADILSSYKGFVNTVKPGTEKIRRLSSLK